MPTTLLPTPATLEPTEPRSPEIDSAIERKYQRQQNVLLAQADVSRKGLPKREIMQRVCSRALDAVGARLVAVARPQGAELCYDIGAGAVPSEAVRVHMDSSLTGHCFRSGEAMLLDDVSRDTRSSLVATRKFSGRSIMFVPIHAQKPIGVLMATSDKPGVFEEADLHTLEVMAGIIASGVTAAAASAERQLLVAERAAALEQLEFQAKLLQTVEQAVIATDLDGNVTHWNAFAEKLYGWSADEARGKRLRSLLVSPDLETRAEEITSELRAGRSWTGDFTVMRRDGTSFVATVSDSPIYDSSGKLIGFVGVSMDRTPQRELEMQLRQAQKMEAVGQLAGGIAHDFNNILTAIIGYSELALLKLPAGEMRDDVSEIHQSATRAADLTKQLLTFSRKQIVRVETVDLPQVVRGLEKMLRRMIHENITLDTSLPERPIFVEADRSQIEQLIMNLVVNARDAMPEGGRLTVSVGIRANSEGVERAHIRVIDNGCGMNEETKRRIFEPFFTTKPEGRGTGLGLAVVFGIVQQLDGTVKVDSAPGEGATFSISLPLSKAVVQETDECGEVLPCGTETILLVEDNEPLSVMTNRVLRGLGYRVIRAINGGSASRLPDVVLQDVELVLTDVVMPEMNGPALVEQLRTRGFVPTVVYMSGYTRGVDLGEGVDMRTARFIPKPWSPRLLAIEVRRALDARKAAAAGLVAP